MNKDKLTKLDDGRASGICRKKTGEIGVCNQFSLNHFSIEISNVITRARVLTVHKA